MIRRTVQISEFLDMIDVKDKDRAEQIISQAFSFLLYMNVGDQLKITAATFNKLAPDLIQIDAKIDPRLLYDSLEKKKIVKLTI